MRARSTALCVFAMVCFALHSFAQTVPDRKPPEQNMLPVERASPTQAAGATQATPELLDTLPFRIIGPASPAGRVWQVIGYPKAEAMPPSEKVPLKLPIPRPGVMSKIWFACTADGGLWRTTNDGTTLEPIFNTQRAASCGAVGLSAANPNVIYLGTGESASTRANSLGRGVYKSTDFGQNWQYSGLQNTEEITAVVVDPRNVNTVYVAALGHLWGRNADRGVFKSTDGGNTWRKVLFIDDVTGISDLIMDPRNSDTLYAAAWSRLRWGDGDMDETSSTAGVSKTTDAGANWTKLKGGLPEKDVARIFLAAAHKNPDIVYATVQTGELLPGGGGGGNNRSVKTGGIFRSNDGGSTWTRVNAMTSSYYYGKIEVDPNDDNRVWLPWFELWRSEDGGKTFVKHNMLHVHDDLHGIWIDPYDSDHIILGGDGGVNVTVDGGSTYTQPPLPIAQFYAVSADNQEPYYVYGGMQDTATWSGPSQTYDNEGITNYDWIKLRYNGDGMAVHADPCDPNVIYMVQEFGNTSRLDLHKWTRTELQPNDAEAARSTRTQRQEGAPQAGGTGALHKLRWDWTPPMVLDNKNADVVYLGANYVFRCVIGNEELLKRGSAHFSVARNGSPAHACDVISPDLTAQQGKEKLRGSTDGYHSYGALFSLAQSPVDANVLWAGSDDGPLYVSRNATEYGPTWTRVDAKLRDVIKGGVISHVEPSITGPGVAYVAIDRHTLDDPHPYLFKTADYGTTWTSITNDLPQDGPTYVIREDPNNSNVLYVGTEFGLYVSVDAGRHWLRWRSNLPTSAVRTLAVQARDRDLVVGTFGRAIWIADISVVEQLAAQAGAGQGSAGDLSSSALLFQPKPAVAYNVRYTYGATIEQLNGDMFFRAPNPPYGTMITYFLKDAQPGNVHITISDSSGKVVRTLESPGTAGLHQVQWDLETDAAKAKKPARESDEEPEFTLSEQQALRRVQPGTYRIALQAGGQTLTRDVVVRAESDGVKRVETRK